MSKTNVIHNIQKYFSSRSGDNLLVQFDSISIYIFFFGRKMLKFEF